jgi:hypothetical protein
MRIVISAERAVADGIPPQSLIAVAEWHEERAATIERALNGKKKRAFGGPVTYLDQRRHEQLALDIRDVALTMMYQARKAAA